MSEIRPRHGWEGLNNGGEIYGSTLSSNQNDRKKEYLRLVKLSLETSMQNTPDAYQKSKEIMRLANERFSDVLEDELEEKTYLDGDGSEIKALLDGMQTDEELEDLNFRRR